jgi:DNA-binding IclR family transcriptional regulator
MKVHPYQSPILLSAEKIFDALKDGEWHDLNELTDQTQIQTNKLIEFSKFLHEQGIITYEDKTHRIKINPEWKSLLPIESG